MADTPNPRSKSTRRSAGLLMYRMHHGRLEAFLAHPGGPFFQNKDEGHWTVPKGEVDPGDDPRNALATAIREFEEETGIPPRGQYIDLGEITQKGGKVVRAWAFEAPPELADSDSAPPVRSNTFTLEWPPKSGVFRPFPEVDRAQFFDLPTARRKIKETQAPFLDRLLERLAM